MFGGEKYSDLCGEWSRNYLSIYITT